MVPSPLGHGLAAVAAGWIVAGKPADKPALVKQVAILAAVGIALLATVARSNGGPNLVRHDPAVIAAAHD